jgi:hypothetical protein
VVRRRGRRRRQSNRIRRRYDVYDGNDGNDEMISMLAMIKLVRIGWSCRCCMVHELVWSRHRRIMKRIGIHDIHFVAGHHIFLPSETVIR